MTTGRKKTDDEKKEYHYTSLTSFFGTKVLPIIQEDFKYERVHTCTFCLELRLEAEYIRRESDFKAVAVR